MSEYLSNHLKLIGGTTIAQIFGILLIPIITRLYSPEDFGLFSLILAISGIIVSFASMSYHLAIMLPKEDKDAANIVVLCCGIIFFLSLVTEVIFHCFAEPISFALNAPSISNYLSFVSIIVVSSSILTVLTYWNSRRKKFGTLSIAQITNSLFCRGFQIGIGFASASFFGLIFGNIIGNVSSILVLLRDFYKDIKFFNEISIRNIIILAIRYKKFPLYNSLSTMANTISTQITPILFAFFFGPLIVGNYSIALQVVSLPMVLVGNAIGQVFFQKACEEKNNRGNIKTIVTELHTNLFKICIFPTLLLIFLGPSLFSLILGSAWNTAGLYAAILAPWFLFVFITSPLSTIFAIFEKLEINLFLNIIVLVSRICALLIGGFLGDPKLSIILLSITGVVFVGGSNLYILKLVDVEIFQEIKNDIQILFKNLLLFLPMLIAILFNIKIEILLVLAGIQSLLFFYFFIRHNPMFKEILILLFIKRSK